MKIVFSGLFTFLQGEARSPIIVSEAREKTREPPLAQQAQTVVHHLTAAIQDVEVMVTQDRPFVFTVRTTGAIRSKIQLLFADLTADIDDMEVAEGRRRQGRCRQFTQELCLALRNIGFDKMTLYAVNDGLVTWAALGFRPTRGAWRIHRGSVESSFRAHRSEFPPAVAQDISDLILANQVNVFPIIANVRLDGQLHGGELAKRILGILKGWHGEFDVGNERDGQYFFREG
ncbi:hypothetical protein [Rhizobium sp.]|uniref:hypothetical protein n=1 Tax=Rhizobium sp. TaxID=391 RepID=UPI000DD6268B